MHRAAFYIENNIPAMQPICVDHRETADGRFCTRGFSHFWLATVQDVLHADWQDVRHSPQPPCGALCAKVLRLMVLMCFIAETLLS
jgi:hypothetical protein